MGLSIERLTVRLGRRTVLHDVAAELRPGRVTALLGPNGAGEVEPVAGDAGADRGGASAACCWTAAT